MTLGFGDLYNANYVLLNLISLIKFNEKRGTKGAQLLAIYSSFESIFDKFAAAFFPLFSTISKLM